MQVSAFPSHMVDLISYVFLIETLSFSVFLQLLSFQEILPVAPMIINMKMYYELIRCLRILLYTSSYHQISKSPLRRSNSVLYPFVLYLPFVMFQICRSYVIHLLKNQQCLIASQNLISTILRLSNPPGFGSTQLCPRLTLLSPPLLYSRESGLFQLLEHATLALTQVLFPADVCLSSPAPPAFPMASPPATHTDIIYSLRFSLVIPHQRSLQKPQNSLPMTTHNLTILYFSS